MPYIKCPYCAYRIMQPMVVNLCPNCGRVLSGEEAASTSGGQPMSTALSSRPGPPPRSEASPEEETITVSSLPPEDGQKESQPGSSLLKHASRPPDIEGIVVGVQTQNDVPLPPDLMGGFFKGLRDIIWPVMETNSQNSRDKTVITQVRVRIANMTQRDARLQGTLTGASISLGDHISLWGTYRKGTLVVRRAYNHTSDAAIITRSTSSSSVLFLLVSVIILVVAVYMVVTHFSQFWPWH